MIKTKKNGISWIWGILFVTSCATLLAGIVLWQSCAIIKEEARIETKDNVDAELPVPKEEITEKDKALIFRKIFPDGNTKTDLDNISDFEKRIDAYFTAESEFVVPEDWNSVCHGKYSYAELNNEPGIELIVYHLYRNKVDYEGVPSWGSPDPFIGPVYVFFWNGEDWNIIGKIEFEWYSFLMVGELTPDGFADILKFHHLSAGDASVRKYEWNGDEYIETEIAICSVPDEKDNPKICSEGKKTIQ